MTMWLHTKTQNLYTIMTDDARDSTTLKPLVVYRPFYGDHRPLWVRPAAEFYDGRFERWSSGAGPLSRTTVILGTLIGFAAIAYSDRVLGFGISHWQGWVIGYAGVIGGMLLGMVWDFNQALKRQGKRWKEKELVRNP